MQLVDVPAPWKFYARVTGQITSVSAPHPHFLEKGMLADALRDDCQHLADNCLQSAAFCAAAWSPPCFGNAATPRARLAASTLAGHIGIFDNAEASSGSVAPTLCMDLTQIVWDHQRTAGLAGSPVHT